MSILESFLAGKEARRVADAAEQVNAMNAFLGQNGQAIFAGDQNALGQLAGFGPQGLQMALGMKGDLAAQERQAQMDAMMMEDRAYGRERDQKQDARADQKWEMELAEYKKGLSAEQAAAEAAALENAAKMALTATSPEQWDELAMQNGAEELVGQFENREAVAAQFMSMAEVLKAQEAPDGPEWRPATPEEAASYGAQAGQINTKTGKFDAQTLPKGTSLTVDPVTGAVSFQEGVGVGGGGIGGPNVGEVYNPAAATDAIALVDDILGVDENGNITPESMETIKGITGAIEGGGGNDIDAMSEARRVWYGEKGLDKIEKLNQLQSKAWLAARDMLKGGGPITDYESRKAEAAVARLSRAKGSKEFVAALTELKEAISEGERKLREARGGASGSGSPPPAFDQSEIDALMAGP